MFQNGSNLVESFLNIIRSYAESPGIFDFKKDQLIYILRSHFGNKRFIIDEMTWGNTLKFNISYIYENPKLCYSTLFLPLSNECPSISLSALKGKYKLA